MDATGWFRTEKVNGKWWFVTPEGHLFFSMGIDCVRSGDSTWTTGREAWFEWTPESDGPFKEFVSHRSGVHSMAEPIGGSGEQANPYGINLKRKYGEDWRAAYCDSAYRRLRAWGFNTLGNWAAGEVLRTSPIPFVVCGRSGGSRAIEASEGFWRRMVDVFDATFAPETEAKMAALAKD